MKKPVLLKLFLALFVITLSSCETEPVDEAVLDNVPAPQNPGGNPGGGTDNGTSEGDYWPMALNNEWVFDSTGEEVEPMKIIDTETIDGVTYYKMNYAFQDSGSQELTGTSEVFLHKVGGSYFQRVETTVPDNEGISIHVAPYELLVLKDNLAEGETWSHTTEFVTTYEMENFPIEMPDVTTEITMEGTIMEKGITLTVNGETYNDVIHEKVVQTVSIELPGTNQSTSTSVTSYVWFAKGVGPLKSVNTSDGVNYTITLTDYTVN
jgi:hypothetical protein